MTEIVDKLCELKQRLKGQLPGRRRTTPCRSGVPVGPLTPDGDTAAYRLPQDQCLDPADAPRLEDGKTLPSKRMEGVTYLSPSQRLVGTLGSPH
jgi:hypothetical protein